MFPIALRKMLCLLLLLQGTAAHADQRFTWAGDFLQQHGYRLVKKVGEGTFGMVVEATKVHEADGSRCAIKIMNFSEENAREAAILKATRSARHLISAREILTHPQGICVVMDLYPQTLTSYIKNTQRADRPEGWLTWEAFVAIVRGIYEGLEELRELGLTHADLKSNNIMLSQGEVPNQIKIIDFGLAQIPAFTRLSTPLLPAPAALPHNYPRCDDLITLDYRPPELMLGSKAFLEAADLWSLGCIIQELLSGRSAFRDPTNTAWGTLMLIFQAFGTPDPGQHEFLTRFPFYNNLMPRFPPRDYAAMLRPHIRLRNASAAQLDLAVELVQGLLSLDPRERFYKGNLRHRYPCLWEEGTHYRFVPQFRVTNRRRVAARNLSPSYREVFPSPQEQVRLADWLLTVSQRVKYHLVSFHGAMALVDRELTARPLGARMLQLRGIAALELAANYFVDSVGLKEIRRMSADAYTVEEIAGAIAVLQQEHLGVIFPNPLQPFYSLLDLEKVTPNSPQTAMVAIILTALAHTKTLDGDYVTYLRCIQQLADLALNPGREPAREDTQLRDLMKERLVIYFQEAAEISQQAVPALLTWCRSRGIEELYTTLKNFALSE
jgi:serine/threonine protein kinase